MKIHPKVKRGQRGLGKWRKIDIINNIIKNMPQMFCYAQIFESILLSTAGNRLAGLAGVGGRSVDVGGTVEGHYDVLLPNE